MSFRATTLWRHYLAVFILGLISNSAFAQDAQPPQPPIVFPNSDAITTTLVQAPATSGGASGDTNWLKVEFHYSVVLPQLNGNFPRFLDAVEFKIWIEGRDQLDPSPQNKPGEGIAIALTGSVTYVNVPAGKGQSGVVFVHPSTLARYTSSRGVSEFERNFNIHIEADVDGKPVAAVDKKREQDPNWYMPPGVRAVAGFVFHQNQTAFITVDPDRYPAIKLPEEK